MVIDKNNYLEYGILTDGTPSAEYAKQELQTFIEKSCGFRLEEYNGQAHYISLGENIYSQNVIAEYDLSVLNEEGFYIIPKNARKNNFK